MLRDVVRAATGNRAVLKYLDDFFGIEPPPGSGAAPTFQGFIDLCDIVGLRSKLRSSLRLIPGSRSWGYR